jgi:Tfp pilus assembly protein PilE
MTPFWIAVLLACGVLAVIIVTSWRHRVEMVELGTVSTQWLAEQRANDRHQSER